MKERLHISSTCASEITNNNLQDYLKTGKEITLFTLTEIRS
jgi:hypothetical protein